jgi:hypothetical protein
MEALLAFAPDCPVRTLFGVPCPGCGLTRALLSCLRGDLNDAVVTHPMAPVLLAQCTVLLVLWFQTWRRPRNRVHLHSLLHQFAILDCVGVVFIWIVRISAGDIP